MSIPTSFIDQLLDQTDIVEVVGRRLQLNKKGSNFWCLCPFHDDSNPSMAVNQDKQFFYCFVCQESGNAIHFLRKYEHLEFVDAIETLASSLGLSVPYEKNTQDRVKPSGLVEQAVELYRKNLNKKTALSAIEYLKMRNISGKTATRFNLGYAEKKYDALASHFGSDITPKELEDSGLFSHKNNRFYDRFRDRIIFPIRNIKGEFIAMGGRIINEGEPKYLNSPETPFFNKSNELYGLYEVRESKKKIDSLIVVEGYMDVIGLYEHGIQNSVATLGTAVTPSHIAKIMRYTNIIFFAFDGDLAGGKAAWKAVENSFPIIREEVEIKFIFFKDNYDPDSYINEFGINGFKEMLDSSMTLSEYFLSKVKKFNLQTIEGRSKAVAFAAPIIQKINNSVIKEIYTNEVSKLCGIDAKNFNPSKESSSKNQQQLNNLPPKVEAPVRVKALVNIFIALLEYPKIAQQDIFDELLTDKKFNFLLRIIELFKEDSNIKPSRIIENIESDKIKAYFSEAVISELVLSEKNAIKLVEDCIDVLLKNQKDREQSLKDKYNVNSITSVERRDLQQIILKKENISDDDRKWLEKLSSNPD